MTRTQTHTDPLVATSRGLLAPEGHVGLDEASVTAFHVDGERIWALVDRQHLYRIDDGNAALVASLDSASGGCLTTHAATVWIGGARARLWRLHNGELVEQPAFSSAPTNEQWHTPWGGPPDVFSMASDGEHLYVSVHVGGILRTTDGETWEATIDLHDDVHQVAVGQDRAVWAATGRRGLAESRDFGATWTYHTEGLHARYALAVAAVDGGALVAVCSGHAGRDGAVYRLVRGRLERVHGLPDELHGAVGPRRLAAAGAHAVAALPNGDVYTSDDGGEVWHRAMEGVPGVTEVALRER